MSGPVMRKRSLGRRLMLGVAVLGAIALVGWLALGDSRDDSKVMVTAVFSDSSPLIEGNQVRLDGMEVGQISKIALVNGKSHVEMELDRAVLPLHVDASARVEPVSLLGERFIALGQGSPGAPVLAEPFTIERTSNAVDLDQLLNTLDDPTSTALAAMVTTLGEGLQGNGDTVAGALKGMAPTFQRVDQVSALLDQQNKVVDHLVVQLQRNLDQFAPPIDSLVDAANQTVGAVAASRQGLNDSLVEFPSTLISARQALGQLATTADNTTPVLRDIRPVTGNLKQVSHELKDFSDAASPALDSLPEVLHRVDKLLDEARPVVNDLKPAASDLSSVSDSVGTIGHQLTKHKNGQASQLENLMSGVANWAMSTSSYDGLSHYFRAYLYISPTSGGKMIAGGLPAIGPHKPFDPLPKDPRGGQDPSGHSGRLPYVPGLYPQPTPDVSTGRGEATDQRQGFGDKPSPLTPSQEGGMFDSLLGGGK